MVNSFLHLDKREGFIPPFFATRKAEAPCSGAYDPEPLGAAARQTEKRKRLYASAEHFSKINNIKYTAKSLGILEEQNWQLEK